MIINVRNNLTPISTHSPDSPVLVESARLFSNTIWTSRGVAMAKNFESDSNSYGSGEALEKLYCSKVGVNEEECRRTDQEHMENGHESGRKSFDRMYMMRTSICIDWDRRKPLHMERNVEEMEQHRNVNSLVVGSSLDALGFNNGSNGSGISKIRQSGRYKTTYSVNYGKVLA